VEKGKKWEFWKHKRLNFKGQVEILSRLYGYSEEELVNNPKLFARLKKPKRLTLLAGVESGLKEVSDLERSFWQRRRSFDRFFGKFEPLYRQRKISLVLITLTVPYKLEELLEDTGKAKELQRSYRSFWNGYRRRCLRRLGDICGVLKLVDVGWQGEKVHFHLVVAVPRVEFGSIPDWLKPDKGLWPYLSRVEFVRKSLRGYLADYLRKPLFELPRGWKGYEVRVYEDKLANLT